MVGATRESDIAQAECVHTRTAKLELWKLQAFKGRTEEKKSVRSSVVVGESAACTAMWPGKGSKKGKRASGPDATGQPSGRSIQQRGPQVLGDTSSGKHWGERVYLAVSPVKQE